MIDMVDKDTDKELTDEEWEEIKKTNEDISKFFGKTKEKALYLGLSRCENFGKFVKENYLLKTDPQAGIEMLVRKRDGKVLIAYQTYVSIEENKVGVREIPSDLKFVDDKEDKP